MPSGDGRWTELSSQNERVIGPDDLELSSATARWDELTSSRERLADSATPLFPQARGRLTSTPMRLVAGAA